MLQKIVHHPARSLDEYRLAYSSSLSTADLPVLHLRVEALSDSS
ncbi:hypothetical protein [Accumulibacter sp.]|nr:hypothetical protein [Accumulibacter sp.]